MNNRPEFFLKEKIRLARLSIADIAARLRMPCDALMRRLDGEEVLTERERSFILATIKKAARHG